MSRLREENHDRLGFSRLREEGEVPHAATLPGRHDGGQIRQVGPNHEFAVVVMDGHDAADRCSRSRIPAMPRPGTAGTDGGVVSRLRISIPTPSAVMFTSAVTGDPAAWREAFARHSCTIR